MDEHSTIPSDDVPDLQPIVLRKLGRCLLRLQQYERQLKVIVANSKLSGPADRLEQTISCAQRETMGTLVGRLTEIFLTPPTNEEESQTQAYTGDQIWFSYRCQLEMPAEHYEEMKVALKELVGLRNKLVHHFLEHFDLRSESGCQAADGFLEESYETINGHCLNLQSWAKAMDKARAFVQSQAFLDALIDGIQVDGSVNWPCSGIYSCLHEAETKLAEGGWTRLEAAIRWIGRTYPEQTPKRYGCSSWRHVLHESRQFEIRKSQADNEGTVVWYRSKVS
ncbi:OST-HTH/LOTUS domain-containing protein [Pseudomonas chlororaphis]|uniref:OST-HTH/LOTUS domain-containing protein n=1 Tax=Pseudomonas chlororaphis TaxID=587753 RepID=UPI0024088091|nr:OST-HTH/LOTUS domain-containing protein [Pseudomonas chlororaphis]